MQLKGSGHGRSAFIFLVTYIAEPLSSPLIGYCQRRTASAGTGEAECDPRLTFKGAVQNSNQIDFVVKLYQ